MQFENKSSLYLICIDFETKFPGRQFCLHYHSQYKNYIIFVKTNCKNCLVVKLDVPNTIPKCSKYTNIEYCFLINK